MRIRNHLRDKLERMNMTEGHKVCIKLVELLPLLIPPYPHPTLKEPLKDILTRDYTI